MADTGSPRLKRFGAVEAAWFAFAAANLVAMELWPTWETIAFHFIWISLTLVYGFRVWSPASTGLVLGLVIAATGSLILADAFKGEQLWGELFEVPLMSAMFLAMVWHARRRQYAWRRAEREATERAELLAQQKRFLHDVSHELRTPVTIARGRLEVLRRLNGKPAHAITLSARAVGGELLVQVADRGQGLPPGASERIFERFARADSARSRAHGGVGLGLAIVDAIVRAHGGRCSAENADGGAVFTLRFPGFAPAPRQSAFPAAPAVPS